MVLPGSGLKRSASFVRVAILSRRKVRKALHVARQTDALFELSLIGRKYNGLSIYSRFGCFLG